MTENTYPLVSIITPAYNQAAYLAETIESILNQDYPNIEYIVLNDGSTDETETVLQQYTERIIWETHKNMGESLTVNKGYAMATGKYVMAVNADDPIKPELVSKSVQYMESHPQVQATYPNWLEIDDKSIIIQPIKTWEADYEKMVRYAVCVPGPGALIRKSGLEKVGGRDTRYRYTSDMDFWFRLGLIGPLAHIPELLATHRIHGEAKGVSRRADVGLEVLRMVEDFFARSDLPPHIRKLKTASLASAHYEAGIRMPEYKEKQQYLRKSFRMYPKGWLKLKYRPLWVWAILIAPEIVSKAVWALFNPHKYFAAQREKPGNQPIRPPTA